MTHTEVVLDYIIQHGHVTQAEIAREYIFTLNERIRDLRKKGHRINTEIKTVVNTYGNKCRYGYYTIDKTPEE